MRFRRRYFNRLQDAPDTADTVVVVDVLRSFTTAAVAFARGATRVHPVAAGIAVPGLGYAAGGFVSAGSLPGGDPAPGFDFGNSPAAIAQLDLAGKALVLSTAAGVAALLRHRDAPRLYAASLVCARATAAAIGAAGAQEVCFVITGEWVDRDGDEDIACADYLEALLRGETVSPSDFEQRVRDSDFGRRFADPACPRLPAADLDLAAQADRFDFAMPVSVTPAGLLITRG